MSDRGIESEHGVPATSAAGRVKRAGRGLRGLFFAGLLVSGFFACSKGPESEGLPPITVAGRAPDATDGGTGAGGAFSFSGNGASAGQEIIVAPFPGGEACEPQTCRELGYGCGSVLQCAGTKTETIINCADEGLTCGDLEVCMAEGDEPARCRTSFGDCEVCSAIPECPEGSPTRLTGRVVTPGRNDGDSGNQVGVPNAVVYILRSSDAADIPPIPTGIPMGETSCDRCEDQDLGPFLLGTVTDATGRFTLEGSIPIDKEFLLVVKVGRFRRAIKYTVSQGCASTALPTALPGNPARLPRSMDDGLAVNIPAIAVSTGEIDAMECVLEKLGLAHDLFGNPGPIAAGSTRVHLFRGLNGGMGAGMGAGESGARIDTSTPNEEALYGSLAALQRYDFVIADCKGPNFDGNGSQRNRWGDNVREYVNRGGRMFASHLSYTWLDQNGPAAYSEANAIQTGLAPAASWDQSPGATTNTTASGTGIVSVGRDAASLRIDSFAAWLEAENVATPPAYTFNILQPRSLALSVGQSSEEFVYSQQATNPSGQGGRGGGVGGRGGGGTAGQSTGAGGASGGSGPALAERIQQFSFNTPYGAPEGQECGRVAYSGFHVAASGSDNAPFGTALFPAHCSGSLTAQEKVLLYMIFDLGACIGELPPPPACEPATCESTGTKCGFVPDGCGKVLDCGPCIIPPPN